MITFTVFICYNYYKLFVGRYNKVAILVLIEAYTQQGINSIRSHVSPRRGIIRRG